jgi:glycosyltransferase involved in cell wall biosynthesis
MKTIFFTVRGKKGPAGRYRGYNLAKELKMRFKIDTKVIPIGSKKYIGKIIWEFLKLLKPIKSIFFVQRVVHPITNLLFKLKKLNGSKIIFDFDDAIFLTEQTNTLKMISLSNAIVTGNGYLADYAKKYNNNVYVIPTSIDLENIGKLRKDYLQDNKKIIIGWIGSESTLKYLQEVKKPLENLSKKYPLELRIIGPANSMEQLAQFKEIPIKVVPWKLETEWEELSKVDIGIMPLPDDEWARGKCALKLLQYMALEIPAIGSNVGANKEVIKSGKNGFLASSEKEWETYLEKLIKDKKLRMKLGKVGRKTVEERYSLEKNAKKLAEIIRSLEGG